ATPKTASPSSSNQNKADCWSQERADGNFPQPVGLYFPAPAPPRIPWPRQPPSVRHRRSSFLSSVRSSSFSVISSPVSRSSGISVASNSQEPRALVRLNQDRAACLLSCRLPNTKHLSTSQEVTWPARPSFANARRALTATSLCCARSSLPTAVISR